MKSNTLGPSSYGDGDKQGSHGDYMHGISQHFIHKAIGKADASSSRLKQFSNRMSARATRAGNNGQPGMKSKYKEAASVGRRQQKITKLTNDARSDRVSASKGKSFSSKKISGWDAWKAKKK